MKKTGYGIVPVITQKDEHDFLRVPHQIYDGDPGWVCPLDMDIRRIFDPKKNPKFQNGKAARWILKNESGKAAGRIAAFIDRMRCNHRGTPTGGAGFFECPDDPGAATLLFDTARSWLSENGMEAMEAPVNFGENDSFWGLLVEGFSPPAYGMAYNPLYYKALFEGYGFQMEFEQISNELDMLKPLPDRFRRIADWANHREGVEFRHASASTIPEYSNYLWEIYNEAWTFLDDFVPVSKEEIRAIAKNFKHVAIEAFMPFAFVHGEPAGFILCIPDLNPVFKPLKGNFSLWQKLLFLLRSRNQMAWYRKRAILTRGRVMAMGIKPRFQRLGLEAGMIMSSYEQAKAMGFNSLELSWVRDINTRMQKLHENVGAQRLRVHQTYHFPF
jgi:hypothetical protein